MKSIYPEWKFNERFDLPTSGEEQYSLLVVDGKYQSFQSPVLFEFPAISDSVRSGRNKNCTSYIFYQFK